MPLVSVIIPAYNAMAFLPQTLESVLKQTFDDFEIIVVNDGSQDHLEEWIATQRDPRIRLICQPNQGLAGARNTGIHHANGQYLSFLDADDLWHPTKLEQQIAVLDNDASVGLVYTGVAIIDSSGQPTGRVITHEIEGEVWEALTQHNVVESGSVAMVRRECFEDCGVFDRNLGSFLEDWDMWLRIAKQFRFKVIQDALVFYRQHANSASKNWQAMERSFEIVMAKNFQQLNPTQTSLKRQSYGHFYLYCLSWKPLQCQYPDYREAIMFQKQAFKYAPSLRYSKENFRLSLAIQLMRQLGAQRYLKVLDRLYRLREQTHFFLPQTFS